MKKILALCACVSLNVVMCFAQTGEGSFLLGGGISYMVDTERNGNTTVSSSSFSLAPSVGYFLSDNFAIGLDLAIEGGKEPYDGVYGYTTSMSYRALGVGPFVRFYKPLAGDKLMFFGNTSVLYLAGSSHVETSNRDYRYDGFELKFSPGFAYFMNERWSLELMFRGIAFTSVDPDKDREDDLATRFEIGANSFTPTIGLKIYFGK